MMLVMTMTRMIMMMMNKCCTAKKLSLLIFYIWYNGKIKTVKNIE